MEAMSVSHNGDTVNSGYTFAFDTNQYGVVTAVSSKSPHATPQAHAQSAIAPMVHFTEIKERTEFMPRVLISTSGGALQLVHGQGIAWTRDESLASIAAARFIDLGEPEVEETRELLGDEGFVARTTRHLTELKVS
jgi:hypothetical protein